MRKYFFFICSFFYISVHCQTNYSYYPVQYSQYMRNSSLINPASIGTKSRAEIILGSRNHTGTFSNISSYFASIDISFKKPQSKKSFSSFGFLTECDREGKYIARTRGYLAYAFHFYAFEGYYVSGGINVGGFNMSVKGTPSTGDKSEFASDANSGIWFYNDNFYAGISINQIFNGKLQPYQEMSILKTHYQLTAMKKFTIGSLLAVKPSFLVRSPSYLSCNYNADYSLEAEISNFLFGSSIRHKLGAAFWVGISDLKVGNGKLEAVVSYNTPFKKSQININSFELVCNYKIF